MDWFRLYNTVIDDPKVLKLPEATRWHWVAVLCISSRYGGPLPPLADVALHLRMPEPKAAQVLTTLCGAKLLDKTEDSFVPHNWDGRQYKTDKADPTNATRQQRYRDRKRNGSNGESNGVTPVTSKRPDTETETDTEVTEPIGSDAAASADPRKRLFGDGLKKLAAMTGKGPDACRSFVGKCLKAAGDDAVTVLGLIEEAERNRVVDPSAWIAARLKPTTFPQGNPHGKRTVQDAAKDLLARVRSFDEPEPTGELRGPAGGAPLRLLSQG